MGEEFVATRDADAVLVVDGDAVGMDVGGFDGGVGEFVVVVLGVLSAFGGPVLEVGQFDEQDGGLDGVESEVATNVAVVVLWFLAMVAHDEGFLVEGLVVGDDHATIACAA